MEINTYNINGDKINIYDFVEKMIESVKCLKCTYCSTKSCNTFQLKENYNEVIKNVLSDKKATEYMGKDGYPYNIFDIFFELCEYNEKCMENSCAGCELNEICYQKNLREEMIKFWDEVYDKGHFKEIDK